MPLIDIVCTYVNSADPARRENLRRALDGVVPADYPAGAFQDARLESGDELRNLLRSIDQYFPKFNKLYLVCDEAPPDWLNARHEQLRQVRHAEIFPDPSVLPVFNSRAIESNLHRIPGLAENFLYCNDDFLFLGPVDADYFFSGGKQDHFVSESIVDWGRDDSGSADQYKIGRINAARALSARYRIPPVIMSPAHIPVAVSKSKVFEMEREFPREFEIAGKEKFRSRESICITYYCWATGASRVHWVRQWDFAPLKLWLPRVINRIRYRISPQRAQNLAPKEDFLSKVVLVSGGEDRRGDAAPFGCVNNGIDPFLRLCLEIKYPKASRFENPKGRRG